MERHPFYEEFVKEILLYCHYDCGKQIVLASKVGMNNSYLSYLINTAPDIKLGTFIKLYKAMGGNPDEILDLLKKNKNQEKKS